MFKHRSLLLSFGLLVVSAIPIGALDRPWVSDVFFYWYTWDYDQQLGGWMGGVHNTPLYGYYDSRTFADNRRSLWLASEWGLTHHFIDYWAPTWKGENDEMREKVLLRAAEDVRRAGYDIWMSYYQDGYNFAMDDFSKNVSEKRDVYQWLRDFASSPVWPQIGGKPMQLVYSNSGAPKTAINHEGFRQYLRKRYSTLEALNSEWGTSFPSFDSIEMDFGATGWQRAFAIRYQYELWRQSWEKLDALVRQEFGYPGMKASFDVAYAPFMGFSYALMDKVFCGPHSYGGIFGQPEDQDVQRFIQAVVAKHYDTVFLDHFKQYYSDWNIRIPGTSYRPDPFHFDRFWVGDLVRFAEAILHLSWNEWWEGSNLEPNWEFGKTYCEKNLFYSTLMQLAFPSIRDFGKRAKVGVVLNDWNFQMGGTQPEDLYQTLQSLRKLNAEFDLIPDDFVTDGNLSRYRVLIAPACGTGFGFNENEERVGDVLRRWAESGAGRHLVVTRDAEMMKWLELLRGAAAGGGQVAQGPEGNVFVDVGESGDEKVLLSGASGRENWGNLPPGAFGAGSGLTVRWTPASGTETCFLLPASPNRDHLLRFQGSAIWDNTVQLLVNGTECAQIAIKPGVLEYEMKAPAAVVGGNDAVEVRLRFAKARIPWKEDPTRFPSESRVCNLALDWVQWSTSNIPARTTKTTLSLPEGKVEFLATSPGPLKDKTFRCEWSPRDVLGQPEPASRLLSRYTRDNSPRDILTRKGQNDVLYVNGSFANLTGAAYWDALLSHWSLPPLKTVTGEDIIGAGLEAGNTVFALASHHDIKQPTEVRLAIPKRRFPLSEASVLSRDGIAYAPLRVQTQGDQIVAQDRMQYYGVYQFAFAPVRVEVPPLLIHPGESIPLAVKVTNTTDSPVSGDVQVKAVIPSVESTREAFSLRARQTGLVTLRLKARSDIDWGQKTVALVVTVERESTYFLRTLQVERNPELHLISHGMDASRPMLGVENKPHPFCANATAKDVRLSIDGRDTKVPDLPSGRTVNQTVIGVPSAVTEPAMTEKTVTLTCRASGQTFERSERVYVASAPSDYARPADALRPVVVFNPSDRYLENEAVCANLEPGDGASVFVRDDRGTPVASQLEGRVLWFVVMVPPRQGKTYLICRGAAPAVSTDLAIQTDGRSGDVTVTTLPLSVTLSPNRGGTATHLVSRATGLDYGQESFGVNYGKFSSYDPTKPAVQTTSFIDEQKTRQSDSPASVRVVSKGPVRCVVQVAWKDRNLQAAQAYEFRAYQPYFRLTSSVSAEGRLSRLVDAEKGREVVVLDARFQPNRLTKAFPNFVGIRDDEEHPHFGWREGRWVPDYFTLMSPDAFEESLSLIIEKQQGLYLVRQGFWPANRPKSGKCERAEVELVYAPPWPGGRPVERQAEVQCVMLFHSKHQVVAQAFQEALREPPLVVAPRKFGWSGTVPVQAREVPRGWFSTFWHHRMEVSLSREAAVGGEEPLTLAIDRTALKGETLDPNSVRVVECDRAGNAVALPLFVFDAGNSTLSWLLPKRPDAPSPRTFHIYFDSVGNGPKPPPRALSSFPAKELVGQSFETEAQRRGWSFSNAALDSTEAHTGKQAVRMSNASPGNPSLLTNNAIRVRPKTAYRVTYWAKALRGSPELRTNFYNGPQFDFEQIPGRLPDASEWREYRCLLPAHDFPAGTPLVFRLWMLDPDCVALVDDFEVKPDIAAASQAEAQMRVVRVDSLE